MDYQIHVVDNNSTDGTSEMVESCFPDVLLNRNKQNDGFAKSHNFIIGNTSSEYILLLNPDITVVPGSIERMIGFLEEQADVGMVACKLLNEDMSLQYSCRRYPQALTILLRGLGIASWLSNGRDLRHYLMADWDHSSTAEVDWIMGSCILLRRDVVREIGLFDERFFMYYEDVDLSLRVWKKWKVCYFPHSYMVHYHLQQSHKLTGLRQKLIHIASAFQFFRKHGPYPKKPPMDRVQENYSKLGRTT